MLQSDQVYEALKYVHFYETEVKVYLALLQKKMCSPAEVVRLSGLNRTMVYDLLKSLEAKGGCILINKGRKLYKPVDPEILLRKGRAEQEQELELCREKTNLVSNDLKLLYENAIESDDEIDYITVMKDPIQIADKIISMSADSKKEILVFSVSQTLKETFSRTDKKILIEMDAKDQAARENIRRRGVKCHAIIQLDNINEYMFGDVIDVIKDNDENSDMRIVDEVPCKVMIFDRSEILIGLKSRVSGSYSALTFHLKDEGLAKILRDSFYARFNNAPSVKELDIDILLNEKRIVRLDEKKAE